jgi:hypothetical protein
VVVSYLVTNTNDSGPGSLREAIYDANTLAYGTAANPDLIQFDLPANDPHHDYYRNDGVAGQVSLADVTVTTATSDSQIPDIDPDWSHSWWSIQPASQMPTITDPVVIDGYSQPGATPNTNAMTDADPGDNAVLRIQLTGGFSGGASGLTISSGNTTVQGMVVNDFGLYGISIGGGGNDTIQGDLVGTDVSGTLAEGNVSIGVLVESAGNTIGGLTAAARNVISANSFQAVGGGYDFGGVDLSSGGIGNVVEGNFIGTDVTGTRSLGNFGAGVMMSFGAANNTIGGTVPQARNVISANIPFPGPPYPTHGEGVMIWRGATNNLVEGNFIGTDVTGTRTLGNALLGVSLNVAAGDGNVIGGESYLSAGKLAGAGNLISGNGVGVINNDGGGIFLAYGNDSQVYGNYIGTDVTGSRSLSNQGVGINTSSLNNIIGGTGGLGNVISGNDVYNSGGILVDPSGSGTVIQNNLIGTDVTGMIVLGNGSPGIFDQAPETSILNNVVAGNDQSAGLFQVYVAVPTPGTANVTVQGNHIGTDVTGSLALGGGGGGGGIGLYCGGVLVGGTSPGASNTIAFNNGYGVEVVSGTGNSILGNSIFSNSGLGIALNSANNANNNQAFPVLTGVSSSGSGTTITGTLHSAASTTFRVEFFANAAADPSGYGQGQTFLGFAMVTTDGTGNAGFTASLSNSVPLAERYISATATVANSNGTFGDTSQFAKDLFVPFNFSGFRPPLAQNMAFALNRTIPIKWQLTDIDGSLMTSLSAVTSLQVAPVNPDNSLGTPFNPTPTPGTSLRNDGSQYIFDWQTKVLAAGTYEILLTLADGTLHTKVLQLTKNGSSAGLTTVAAGGTGSAAGALLGGDIDLYVDNTNGELTADQLARIQDAVTAVDTVTEPYGVAVMEVADPTLADVTLNMDTTSAVGGYADGVLGCTTDAGQITIITGWNFYAGSDQTQIGSGQYDFETVVTHELGHALGLGHSSDSTSVMYATLNTGTVNRSLTTADLNVPDSDTTGACGLHAAPQSYGSFGPSAHTTAINPDAMAPPSIVSGLSIGDSSDNRGQGIRVIAPATLSLRGSPPNTLANAPIMISNYAITAPEASGAETADDTQQSSAPVLPSRAIPILEPEGQEATPQFEKPALDMPLASGHHQHVQSVRSSEKLSTGITDAVFAQIETAHLQALQQSADESTCVDSGYFWAAALAGLLTAARYNGKVASTSLGKQSSPCCITDPISA